MVQTESITLENLITAHSAVQRVMHNLPMDFAMRADCPTDDLMHALGVLSCLIQERGGEPRAYKESND